MTILEKENENSLDYRTRENLKQARHNWERTRPHIFSFKFPPNARIKGEDMPISWYGDDSFDYRIITPHYVDQMQAEQEIKQILINKSNDRTIHPDMFAPIQSGHIGKVGFISWHLIKECAEIYLRQMGLKAVPSLPRVFARACATRTYPSTPSTISTGSGRKP